jgi:hypothetical protein
MSNDIGSRFGSIATHQLYAIRGCAKIYGVDEVVFVKRALGEKATYLTQVADLCAKDAVLVLDYARELIAIRDGVREGELVMKIADLDERLRHIESLHEPLKG